MAWRRTDEALADEHSTLAVRGGPWLPPVEFEGPILVVEGIGVTHLRYRVVK